MKLWIRLSLAFSGVLLVAIVLPLLAIVVLSWANVIDPAIVFDDERAAAGTGQPPDEHSLLHALPDAIPELVLAIAVTGIVTSIWVSRSVTAPITAFAEAAKAIGNNDFSRRVHGTGSREIADLAHTFNQMTADLERTDGLRRQLLADVAHELRTPLTILEGHLRAALDRVYALDEEELANLYGQTQHLIRLVHDLHELAQAEAKQLPLTVAATDLVALIEETVMVFVPVAEEKAITVAHHHAQPVLLVQADAARLRQVLHNLLSNAVRHTPQGGAISVASVRERDAVHITISNSGDGIAAEHLPYLFERFYRVDRGRSRGSGGTGLGLAIVKALVEAHGGTIGVASSGHNDGAMFTLRLPVT